MKWWTRGIRSIFFTDEGEQVDLFVIFPGLRRFLASRRHYALLRTIGDIVFILIILSGLFGPQEPDRNVAVFLIWGVLWPVIVFSWFFVGRMWCGVCPYPGLGVFLQFTKLTLGLRIPQRFEKYGVYSSVVLLAVTFWIEVVAELDRSPAGTSLLIIFIVLGATLFAALFEGRAWCRFLCPLGRISGAAATMALLEFRPDHDKCRVCATYACKRGRTGKKGCPIYLGAYNVKNSLHCLICGHCLELCDLNSPRLLLRNPFLELIRNKGRFIACSHLVPFLVGSQLARFFLHTETYGAIEAVLWHSRPIAFSTLLLFGFFFALGVIHLGNKMFTISEDPIFGKFSPMVAVLLPLSFAGELVYRLKAFFADAGHFLPIVGRQFYLPLLEKASFTVAMKPLEILYSSCILAGGIFGCFILWHFSSGDFEGLIPFRRFLAVNTLLAAMAIFYLVLIS